MRWSQACVVGVLASAALVGCGTVTLHESRIDTAVSVKSVPIVAGQTDRAEVRRLLGPSKASSEYWGFDLFQLTDSERELFVVLFVPVPAGYTETGYVLATYGADGRVAALDRGVAHGLFRPSCPPSLQLEAAPVGFVELGRPRAKLSGFTVEAGGIGEYVFAGGTAQKDYLETVSKGDRCTILMGCKTGWTCAGVLSIDGHEKQLPPKSVAVPAKGAEQSEECPVETRNWLVPLSLEPGTHRLDIFFGETPFASASVQCVAGDVLYAQIGEPIEITRQAPEALIGQPLLIYDSGVWLVPQEPDARSIVASKD